MVSLESAFTKWTMETRELLAEVTCLNDRKDQLDLERDLVFVFLAVQVCPQAEVVMKEIDRLYRERVEVKTRLQNLVIKTGEVMTEKDEIEKVCSEKQSEIRALMDKLSDLKFEIGNEIDGSTRVSRERDALRAELDVQIEQTNGLELKPIEEEKRVKRIQEDTEKLEVEYSRVVEDMVERERRIEVSNREFEALKRYIVEWVQLNIAELEAVRNAAKNKATEVENHIRQRQILQNSVAELRKQDTRMLFCKDFFTMFSATAILAAAVACVAYVNQL